MPEQPAADRAYSVTKELVLSGELPGGHLFSEGDIAQRLGISRTPVREAFLRLQAEDLLTLVPKRGAVVAPVPPGEAEDVLDAREAVETAAVRRLVARGAITETVEKLRAALRVQEGHAKADDLAEFASADESFHRAIVEAGGNKLTLRFYVTLADRQRRMNMHALGPAPSPYEEVLADHLGLLRKIEDGDVPGFGEALRDHLDRTHRR